MGLWPFARPGIAPFIPRPSYRFASFSGIPHAGQGADQPNCRCASAYAGQQSDHASDRAARCRAGCGTFRSLGIFPGRELLRDFLIRRQQSKIQALRCPFLPSRQPAKSAFTTKYHILAVSNQYLASEASQPHTPAAVC